MCEVKDKNEKETEVENGNVTRVYAGGENPGQYCRPIIELLPMNASAADLGPMRVEVNRFDEESTGFKIKHNSADGTERVFWRLRGYVCLEGYFV